MELAEGWLKPSTGFGQRVGDPRRRSGMHCALDDPFSFELAESSRKQSIRHAWDCRA